MRSSWTSRYSFYLATLGTACGLGNIWRFPYIVAQNGGGAFVLIYLFLALTLGLSVLIAELMLGKVTHSGILLSFERLAPHKKSLIRFFPYLPLVLTFLVLCYFAVISGWTLHFVFSFFLENISQLAAFLGGWATGVSPSMAHLMTSPWLQLLLASVHLLFLVVITSKGFQDGLEKWVGLLMPFFSILLVVLVIQSLALPTGVAALRYIFYPDFSKLTFSSLGQALGHVLFTLSIGFGMLVTFGSYLKDKDHLPTAGVWVTFIDTTLSLFATLLIFPIALSLSAVPLNDPALLFESLPPFFQNGVWGSLGTFFGFLFFLFLYLSALGASLGLFETLVTNTSSKLESSRTITSWSLGAVGLAINALIIFLGRSSEKPLIHTLDSIFINWLLPLVALGICGAVGWLIPKNELKKIFVDARNIESEVLFSHWIYLVRLIVPAVILLALSLQAFDLF